MSKRLSRRSFLAKTGKIGAGATAMARAGGPPAPDGDEPTPEPTPNPDLEPPEAGQSGPWGEPDDDKQAAALLPEELRPDGILELFLWGGVSPFDAFAVIPEYGDPDAGGDFAGEGWWAFAEGEDNVSDVFYDRCGGGERPLLEPWRLDGAGRQTHLGPYVYPLRERPDLLARMRMLVMSHNLAPHQGAVPAALGGHIRGNPRLAGFGTHIERYFQDRQEGGRDAPYSWVLFPDRKDVGVHNTDAAIAVGHHRAAARPMAIKLSEESRLVDLLTRANLGERSSEVDAALTYYLERYRGRYVPGGGEHPVRAPALADYEASIGGLSRADVLRGMLPPDLLAPVSSSRCGEDSDLDLSTMQLRLATHLLTRSVEASKYVCVVDGGVLPATLGAAYDTHRFHTTESMRNLTHTFAALVSMINEPGENDPDKLDLDRHQIVITTEFGRSPYRQDEDGTNHWPWGYVQMVLGGWVDEDRSGIVGAIPESGYAAAADSISPAEFRASIMLGMGIWPFNPQAFGVGDTRVDGSEADAAHFLRERVLGYPA